VYGWGTPDWLAPITDWLGAVPVEHLTRPWSTVWTVEGPHGTLWFKENCPPHRAEAAVHAVLARLAPPYVDAPVRIDADRGWLLTRDGGPTVMDAAPDRTAPETVRAFLRDYAALQRATLDHRDELLAAGLRVDGDPASTARTQADTLAVLPADDPRHLTPARHHTVLSALSEMDDSARALAAGPVPLALDQCDLFPRNVFLPRAARAPYRFFDFADATWTHPFGSLVMLIWALRHRHRLPPDEPVVDCRDDRIRSVFDAYLTGWTDYAPPPRAPHPGRARPAAGPAAPQRRLAPHPRRRTPRRPGRARRHPVELAAGRRPAGPALTQDRYVGRASGSDTHGSAR
jgi:hypothetical protein